MKTLANCNPKEFLVQTNKIRKSVEKWLKDTQILEIRKRIPHLDVSATDDERKEALEKQVKQNLTDMFDAILEEYPEETAELLGLLCFIDPDDLENHKMTELLGAFNELLNSEEVISFFISLTKLAQIPTSNSVKA